MTQPTQLDDDQLDYITGEQPDATHQRQQSAKLEDNGSGSETESRQRPIKSRANSTKFEANDDHPKRRRRGNGMGKRTLGTGQSLRKGQTLNTTGIGKSKRKQTEKPATKRDKTLTQMDFVRRYITIDDSDDNDVNMGYIQPPHEHSATERGPICEEDTTPKASKEAIKPEPTVPSKRNRRILEQELDLSTGEPLTSGETQSTNVQGDQQNSQRSDLPSTPRRPRKFEIPSSQSPESPGLTVITSSQFRYATDSPSKQKPSDTGLQEGNCIKKEPSAGLGIIEELQDPVVVSQVKTPAGISSNETESPKQARSISANAAQSSTSKIDSISQDGPPDNQLRDVSCSQRDRTVVYETDAEPSGSEFGDEGEEDEEPSLPRRHGSRESVSGLGEESPHLLSDDAGGLPLPETQPPGDMNFDLPSELPMSDASAYYQREQLATQFPHEPVPNLNTQKLSELFPNEGSTPNSQHKPAPCSQKFPGPFIQSQSQSQEPDQTDIVPESSPIREQQNDANETADVFQRPRAPYPVVQVESSQPVRHGEPSPRTVLSRSQLLTSSVMESIALPNFWTGTQDSVGEPYSLPDH